MTRSEAAFHLSCEKLFDENDNIYFWTFTFTDVLDDWIYSYRWKGFARTLCQCLYGGTLLGLRVIEPHESHGLHYHALLNQRVWVRMVRRIGKRWGIGRVHVEKADRDTARYLAKYLRKGAFNSPVRLSKWGTVGGFKAVRVQDIIVESGFNDCVKATQSIMGIKRLPANEFVSLWRNYWCGGEYKPREIVVVPGSSTAGVQPF